MRTEYESEAWKAGKLVCGLDEAGRGPLAGPLVVAGVVFCADYENDLINDSKKLSESKREKLFPQILKDALYTKIVIVEPAEIDKLDIYHATQKAMEGIAMELPAELILSDAMPLTLDKEVLSLIKGDSLSVSIAAASILAKVTRDRIMKEYDLVYPGYGFGKHKGYGTREHLKALDELGVTPIHRRSFAPVKEKLMEPFDLFHLDKG